MTYLRKRKNAFVYAFKGLGASIRKESHMRIHLGAALLVVCFGFYYQVTTVQWVALLSCITMVIVAELFNTAIEKICDLVSTDQRPEIGYIKDISSAAVLLMCLLAVVVGLFVFLPYIK